MSIYQFAKDFTPIIASVAAFSVTWVLGRGQKVGTAGGDFESQAATALDQLRYNLFRERYAIYDAARNAIEISLEKRNDEHMPNELNALFLKFEESRFFFPYQIYLFLDQLHKDIMGFFYAHNNYRHRREGAQSIIQQNEGVRQMLAEEEVNLLELEKGLYITKQNLPKTFSQELAFPQLTGTSATR